MSDGRANIKVSREFFEEHNPKRKELGLDWEDYIAGNAPEAPEVTAEADVDYAEIERRAKNAVESVLSQH